MLLWFSSVFCFVDVVFRSSASAWRDSAEWIHHPAMRSPTRNSSDPNSPKTPSPSHSRRSSLTPTSDAADRLSPSVYHSPRSTSLSGNLFNFPEEAQARLRRPMLRKEMRPASVSFDVAPPDIVISPPPKSPVARRKLTAQMSLDSSVRANVPIMGGELSFVAGGRV